MMPTLHPTLPQDDAPLAPRQDSPRLAPPREHEAALPVGTPTDDERRVMASLIDEVSNRIQVILGYAQILHELDGEERHDAIRGIEQESAHLRDTLRVLTGWTRDSDGQGPWQEPRRR